MTTEQIVTIIVVVIAILIIAAVLIGLMVARRRRELREQYGPEYDRAVRETGGHRAAEKELKEREERHEQLKLRPLTDSARERYSAEWREVQAEFVDAPEQAVAHADRLVTAVMSERGYPTESYRQQVADLSVEHAQTLDHYRAAREISGRSAQGKASTEDLRQAMVHYRALFGDLLDHSRAPEPARPEHENPEHENADVDESAGRHVRQQEGNR